MPETAAGRALLDRYESGWMLDQVDAIEAEARALGRAEALDVEWLADIIREHGIGLDRAMKIAEQIAREDRAAIDNLETPDPELDAYAAGFNPARHADQEEL